MFGDLVAKFRSGEHGHAQALELFLANGANVDKNTSKEMAILMRWRQLVGRGELFDATRPTILDEVFYLNRSLFDKLSPYSKVPVSRITRTGLLVTLEHGSQTLREYLSARQSVTPSFNWRYLQSLLELLLAEQFTIPQRVDLRIVQGLFEFGVDFEMPSVGGAIGERVLEGVVAQYGTGGLECLTPHLTDFPTKAVWALVRAARWDNFEDVEFLLRKGVDPNAFIIENVSLFLREGADVNSPADGDHGSTALGVIVKWSPATEDEHERKMRICHLLIDQGADVDPAPDEWGSTLLGEAAIKGDLEVAALLLREGADVNAASPSCGTALDAAALYGRLDMVKFLLNANALSFHRGVSGYDGAISRAENNGNLAVADVIREHATKVEAGTVFNPELLKAQDCEYGSTTCDSSCDCDHGSSSDGDAEDVNAAGGTSGLTNTEFSHWEVAQTEQSEQVVPGAGALSRSDPGFVLSEATWPMGSEGEYIQHTDILDPTETWTGQVTHKNRR
ncbi:hypothetical protein Daus18300_001205 [Diaporthe australafricana]|uniref:Ankyrin repeat protein n=1 Tax=Diaporthe australafricana TaxID=127596 RepID=A0ABR3Y0N7_9PEZI